MEHYASKEATIAFLESIGFKPVEENKEYFDSPKNSPEFNSPIIQAYVYKCNNGYYCVSLEGDWSAPVVWNGPKATYDDSDISEEFITFLDIHYSGWR